MSKYLMLVETRILTVERRDANKGAGEEQLTLLDLNYTYQRVPVILKIHSS